MRPLVAAALAAAVVWAAGSSRAAWLAAPSRGRAAALRPPALGNRPLRLASLLAEAGIAGQARSWARVWAGLGVGGLGLGWLAGGPVLAGLGLSACVVGPWLLLSTRRGRGPAALEAGLPPVLEATARGLRAGASLPVALASAAAAAAPAVAPDLASVVSGAGNDGLVAALDRWAAKRPRPGVRLAAAALALAAEVGGGGARALDGVALTLRQRQAAAGEVRALATQARLSAVVLTVAPLLFAALAAAADPRTASVLLRSPLGQGCLATGLVLDAVGAAWMARITRAGAT